MALQCETFARAFTHVSFTAPHDPRMPPEEYRAAVRQGRAAAAGELYDIFPTVCALTGSVVPEQLDGRSLTDLFSGMPGGWRDEVFLTYSKWQRALRTERWGRVDELFARVQAAQKAAGDELVLERD